MEDYRRTLLAAQGYCELRMYEDSLAELATLPPEANENPMVVEMHLVVLMQAKRWAEALEQGRRLCHLKPEGTSGWIHVAFCLHETGRTSEAREALQQGPPALQSEPTFHYNMACYEATLGNVESARAFLEASVRMDAKFREFARTDPDLEPLRRAE